jgi:hypothetical protein
MVRRIPEAEAHEREAHRAEIRDRVVAAADAPQLLREALEALVEQRIDQAFLVAEVVVDRRRGEAAALHQAPDREAVLALLEQQRLGGIENGAAHLGALRGAALFEGGGSHGGGSSVGTA